MSMINTSSIRQEAHEKLDQAFESPDPVIRKECNSFVAALVTFSDRVRRHEQVLANPRQFDRVPAGANDRGSVREDEPRAY